jgi:nitrite reductase (NAD(P)H)
VIYGTDSQLAIFHVPGKGYHATQQMCPHKRAFVLDQGIIGDDKEGNLYVSCPCVSAGNHMCVSDYRLHKRNYRLDNGECGNDADFSILAFKVKADEDGNLLVKLPPEDELDALIGRSRCA